MKEKVLYGIPKNESDDPINEKVLLEGKTNKNNKDILKYAVEHFKDYKNFRILEFDLNEVKDSFGEVIK